MTSQEQLKENLEDLAAIAADKKQSKRNINSAESAIEYALTLASMGQTGEATNRSTDALIEIAQAPEIPAFKGTREALEAL